MDVLSFDLLMNIKPAVLAAAGFPFLAALAVWLLFYKWYDDGYLAHLTAALLKAADAGEACEGASMDNLEVLDAAVDYSAPIFAGTWKRMKSQLERQFAEGLVPEAKAFFSENALITLPGGRRAMGALWGAVAGFVLLAVLLPAAVSLILYGMADQGALLCGICGAVLVVAGQLIFVMADQKAYRRALMSFNRFTEVFDTVLPVAGALSGAALLLKATNDSRETILQATSSMTARIESAASSMTNSQEAAAARITDKFTEFADGGVLPALRDAVREITDRHIVPSLTDIRRHLDTSLTDIRELLDTTLTRFTERQENGMAEMTSSFAARMSDTLEVRMSSLAEGLDDVAAKMASAGETSERQMNASRESLEALLSYLNAEYRRLMEKVDESLERHMNKSNEQAAGLLTGMADQLGAASSGITGQLGLLSSGITEQLGDMSSGITGQLGALASGVTEQLSAMAGETRNQLAQLAGETRNQLSVLAGETNTSLGSLAAETRKHLVGLAEETSAQYGALVEETRTQTGVMTTEISTRFGTLVEEMDGKLTGIIGAMEAGFKNEMEGFESLIDENREVLKQSSGVLVRAAELQGEASDNNKALIVNVADMAGSVTKFQTQTETFIRELMDFSQHSSRAQLKISEDINAAQIKLEESLESSMEKYTQLSGLISGMMNDITERMNDAMAGAGREIAKGISQVTVENAEAISALTTQAQQLREDYLLYFERMENSTKTAMEDMDYQMHNLIGIMNDGVSTLLKDTVEENSSVLSQYKDQTTEILRAFEEQAMSISLYAKEINMDINDLTAGIKGAVEEFTEKIKNGVRSTIGEFDDGLAEVTARLANTVESISDAIENLPAVLNRN